MMKKAFILMMVFILMTGTSVFAYTFSGKVVDAETKEPIEGAVVVAHWNKEAAFIIEAHQSLKDVKETLTNKNGEWTIKGPKGREPSIFLRIISHLPFVYYTLKPNFIIFKPGATVRIPRDLGLRRAGAD
jgi:hypothetical protein